MGLLIGVSAGGIFIFCVAVYCCRRHARRADDSSPEKVEQETAGRFGREIGLPRSPTTGMEFWVGQFSGTEGEDEGLAEPSLLPNPIRLPAPGPPGPPTLNQMPSSKMGSWKAVALHPTPAHSNPSDLSPSDSNAQLNWN